MSGRETYLGRDYGRHLRQVHEYEELCGLHEPHRDPDHIEPAGPPLSSRALDETTQYPMDEHNTTNLRKRAA